MISDLGPLLWLADVRLEMCQPLDDFRSGPPALAGGRAAGDVSLLCACNQSCASAYVLLV
jgi:hypothetical protein